MKEAAHSEEELNTKMKHLKDEIGEFRIGIQTLEQK
mgnify:CR=1 FL=1